MPNQEISFLDKGDVSCFMNPGSVRQQSLDGFDDDYVDIVDYILRCTHKIWEEHGIGRIASHYDPDVIVWTAEGVSHGVPSVVAGTGMVQAAFPDVRLYGDDVIWSGDDREGFHTSHRISWVGHNTGYSKYGPPTGRRIYRFGTANCFVRENRIIEEWIARDELGLILQLGLDPWKAAQSVADRLAGAEKNDRGIASPSVTSRGAPVGVDNSPINQSTAQMLVSIWDERMIHRIDEFYSPTCLVHAPAGRELYGHADVKAFVLSMIGAIPDLSISVDHVISNGDDEHGHRVMARWTFRGTHSGPGVYGAPSGRPVQMLVIGHYWIKDGRIVEEWTAFDEFVLLAQMCTPSAEQGEG